MRIAAAARVGARSANRENKPGPGLGRRKDVLDGGDVLPGFQLPLNKLFARQGKSRSSGKKGSTRQERQEKQRPLSVAVISWRLSVIRLEAHDLLDAARMSAALEIGFQPDLDHALDQFLAEQIG